MTSRRSQGSGEGPLLSFVVVTHDDPIPMVVDRIIRSIANQSHVARELILVGENCSHLGELATTIHREFPGLLSHWFNESGASSDLILPWARVGRCRNLGIAMAQGDFISCQDDDNELEHDFGASLLDCLLSNDAEAAWCYRRFVMPDDSPYPGTFFPWADPFSIRGRLLYDMWVAAGVVQAGSDVVKDQLIAMNSCEVFSTVDSNAWLIKADILRQFPFREKFGYQDLVSDTSFDDIWNNDIRAAGVRTVCSEKASLIYRLGGASTCNAVSQWLANASPLRNSL